MSYRNNKLDFLRVMSMIMVIIIHIANYYCRSFSNISKASYLGALIFNTISRISVPIFFMISGATLLSKEYDKDKNRLRIKRKIITLIIITIIYIVWDTYFMNKSIDIVNLLYKPERKLLWFMYAIIGIYISLPFVKCMIDNMGFREDRLFVVLWISFNGILKYIGISDYFRIPIIDGTYYLGYFIIGYLIIKYSKEIEHKKKNWILILITILSFIIVITTTYIITLNNSKHFTGLLTYSNLFIIVSSISSFIFIYFNIKDISNSIISKLSYLSFGIYLIHGILLNLIMYYIPYSNINSFIGIPIILIIILIFSCLIITLIKKNKFIKNYL